MSVLWKTGKAPIGTCTTTAMQQHRFYAAACRRLGCTTKWLVAENDGKTIASALVVSRRLAGILQTSLITRGPVWAEGATVETCASALETLPEVTAGRRGITLVSPDAPDGRAPALAGYAQAASPVAIASLDLLRSPDALRAQQSGKWRNRLSRAERANLTVKHEVFCPDRHSWLLETETENRRKRGYKGLPLSFVSAWSEVAPNSAVIFTASHSERCIAAMLFLLHAPGASYQIGWSGEQGRKLNAHNLLLWRASLWLAKKGYTALDLGRLDPAQTPNLDRFKLGSGATRCLLGPTYLRAPFTRLAGHVTGRIARARNAA